MNANEMLATMVEAMETANRKTGKSVYSWKLYKEPTVAHVLERDVLKPKGDWANRATGSESVVLNPDAYIHMLELFEGNKVRVARLMIAAVRNVTGITFQEAKDIVAGLAHQNKNAAVA